jgi:molybdopterin converting factor small subunit
VGIARRYIELSVEPIYIYGYWIKVDVKIRLRLSNPLKDTVGKSKLVIDFGGGSVENFLKGAGEQHPKLGDAILSKEGSIDYSINVVLNGRPLTEAAMQEELRDGDEIALLTAVAGG